MTSTNFSAFAISGVLARSPLAISFNFATEIFLLLEISSSIELQTEFNNDKVCSLLASLILLSKKGSTALLYFPWRMTSIFTPDFSCKSLKNINSADIPLKSKSPTGFMYIVFATEFK